MDITKLTTLMKTILEQFRKNLFTATEVRYVRKNPVATLEALKNIENPTEGEERQVLSYLPAVVRFTYNEGNTTDGEETNNDNPGRWNTKDLDVDSGEEWVGGTKYDKGETFNFMTQLTTAKTADNLPIEPGVRHIGQYVDDGGNTVDKVASTNLTISEMANIMIVTGAFEANDQTITQAETDAVFLID